jgi:hypothetical protein
MTTSQPDTLRPNLDTLPADLPNDAGLDAQQRCKVRRAVRDVADEPVETIRRVIEAQAEHYGLPVEVIAKTLARKRNPAESAAANAPRRVS